MRYQRLDIQEATWKLDYLLKKHREGESITQYQEQSLIELKIKELLTLQNAPEKIEEWIKKEMTAEQRKKMRQSIRARRKRFFNAEKQSTKKKSIDLDYGSWTRLATFARKQKMTLSDSIQFLLDSIENTK